MYSHFFYVPLDPELRKTCLDQNLLDIEDTAAGYFTYSSRIIKLENYDAPPVGVVEL